MKVEDRHISEALRLGGLNNPMPREIVAQREAGTPGRKITMAHALTLAKLECTVEALERLIRDIDCRIQGDSMPDTDDAEYVLTQIRSESHE